MEEAIIALIEKYLGKALTVIEPLAIAEAKKLALEAANHLLVWAKHEYDAADTLLTNAKQSLTETKIFHGRIWKRLEIDTLEIIVSTKAFTLDALQKEIDILSDEITPTETVSNPAN
jgi:hypothetical protein